MKVAKILGPFSLALNEGAAHGVKMGTIYAIHSEDVIDPETGANLGRYPKLKVKVTEVYERFCVAETYLMVPGDRFLAEVNIGDSAEALVR